MTNGSKPYGKWQNSVVIENVVNGYVLPCPGKCPEDLYSAVIKPCFIYETKQRPSFATLVDRFAVVVGDITKDELKRKKAEQEQKSKPVDDEEATEKPTSILRSALQPKTLAKIDEERTGMEFNHGEIDYSEAERRLRLCPPPGTKEGESISVHERELYLVREISTLTLVVSILREGTFGHHIIDFMMDEKWNERKPPKGMTGTLGTDLPSAVEALLKRWKVEATALPKQTVPLEVIENQYQTTSVIDLDVAKFAGNNASDCSDNSEEESIKPDTTVTSKTDNKKARHGSKKNIKGDSDSVSTITNPVFDGTLTKQARVQYTTVEPSLGANPSLNEPSSLAVGSTAPESLSATGSTVDPPDAVAYDDMESVLYTSVNHESTSSEKPVIPPPYKPRSNSTLVSENTQDPFAATAVSPQQTPTPVPRSSSSPPRAAPRRPSVTDVAVLPNRIKLPSISKGPSAAKIVDQLNPFPDQNTDDESDDNTNPPAIEITPAKSKKKAYAKSKRTPKSKGSDGLLENLDSHNNESET